MKKLFLIGSLLAGFQPLWSQYYYNDVYMAAHNQASFKKLVNAGVRNIAIKALDPDGSEAINFFLNQKVDARNRKLITFARSAFSDASILESSFNEQWQVTAVLDSSDGASTRTLYHYNASGSIQQMESNAMQAAQPENVVREIRTYRYHPSGQPAQMWLVKNQSDSTEIRFIPAENGLPGEEQWWKQGKKIETWYYYYDAQNRLTDIVRYNAAVGKMLPDYLFGYDDKGNLTSKVTVQPVTGAYRIWQYNYDARGLVIKETVMNKDRKQEGTLLYTYD